MLRNINPKQALPRKYDNILPVRNWAPKIRAKPTENRNGFVKRTFMTFILLLCCKYTTKDTVLQALLQLSLLLLKEFEKTLFDC